MIEIKITVDTVAELHAQLQALLKGTTAVTTTITGTKLELDPAFLRSAEEQAALQAGAKAHSGEGSTLSSATAAQTAQTAQTAEQPAQPKGRARKAAAETKPAAAVEPEPSHVEELNNDDEEQPGEAEPKVPELKYEKDIAPLVLEVVRQKGKDTAMKTLRAFEANNAKEVAAARWPDFITALNKALAA